MRVNVKMLTAILFACFVKFPMVLYHRRTSLENLENLRSAVGCRRKAYATILPTMQHGHVVN